MEETEVVIVTALILLAAPFATTMAGATADENATWGLCQADENNDQGDNSSNGTVSETPPFANLSDEDCENAEHPANATPGEDAAPEDTPDGEDAPEETPDEDDNPGQSPPDQGEDPPEQGDPDEGEDPDQGEDPDEGKP